MLSNHNNLDSSHLELEKTVINLANFVEETVQLLAPKAQAKRLELLSFIAPEAKLEVIGDPHSLQQILIILIDNAIKHTEVGEVIVRVETIKQTNRQIYLQFAVGDSGSGISSDRLTHLFEFSKEHLNYPSRNLAKAKQLVELMAGEIGVDSGENQGSLFWFVVPLASIPQKILPEHTNLGSVKVLVVDDNELHCEIVGAYLKSWGVQSLGVFSGKQALEELIKAAQNNHPFDVAIIDIVMPGMNGFELAETIRQNPQLAKTQMVVLTEFNNEAFRLNAEQSGFTAFLTKPLRQNDLFKILVQTINQAKLPDKAVISPTGQKIMLVEDNPVNLKIISALIKRFGYEVRQVSSGKEAIQVFNNGETNLIFMDIQMPEMDGFQTTRSIRQYELEQNLKRIPIIALTANGSHVDKDKYLSAGMDDYLIKPVNSQLLKDTIQKWLLI